MKIVFTYYNDTNIGLTECVHIKSNKKKEPEYRKYLITGIMEDFQYPDITEDFIVNLKDIETGKKEEMEWDGQAFQHKITKDRVEFVHTIFGDCEQYPKWHCSFEEYKKVLKGWAAFIKMPENIESSIEIKI